MKLMKASRKSKNGMKRLQVMILLKRSQKASKRLLTKEVCRMASFLVYRMICTMSRKVLSDYSSQFRFMTPRVTVFTILSSSRYSPFLSKN